MKRGMGLWGMVCLGILWAGVSAGSAATESEEQGVAPAAVWDPAQPGSAEMAPVSDETEYAYGVVQSVADGVLVVSEYDLTAGKTVQTTYTLDPLVSLTNVRSLDEIISGDGVDIDYVVRDGNRIAIGVSVEKVSDEEGLEELDEGVPLY